MQIAYKAKDISEAHIVASLLVANGIHAHVGGHYLQGALGEIGVSDTAIVHVKDEDYLQARIIVGEYDQNQNATQIAAENNNPVKTTLYVLSGFVLVTLALISLFNFN